MSFPSCSLLAQTCVPSSRSGGADPGRSGCRSHAHRDHQGVRHNETRCTRAHRNGPKRTGGVARETAQNRAHGNPRKPVNRSLDHVIGVRIPTSQPNPTRNAKSLHGNELPVLISSASFGPVRRVPRVSSSNASVLNALAQVGTVRIPGSCWRRGRASICTVCPEPLSACRRVDEHDIQRSDRRAGRWRPCTRGPVLCWSMEIKILRPEDAAVLLGVGPDVFDDAVNPRVATEFLNDPRHHLVAAIDRGVVVGFASAVHYVQSDKRSPEMWINEVGVATTHRGQRVARAILQRPLDVAQAIGCVEAWVLTDRTNEAALRLYKSSGGIEAPSDQVMLTFRLEDSGASNEADDDPRRSG